MNCIYAGSERPRGVENAPECGTISEAGGCANTARPLTHSTSTQPKEGLVVKATPKFDLTGKRFGRLVAIAYAGGSGCRWDCVCDCGSRKLIRGGDLRKGATRSCGCISSELKSLGLRLPDMAGQRFGRLKVIEFTEMRKGESFWLCLCDCGATTEVRGWMLRNSTTRSCGCLHREVVRADRTATPSYGAIHSRLRITRGPAGDNRCVDCGDRAEQWSYDHDDPNALVSEIGHPYSADLAHYEARCCSCHRRFDSRHGGAA